MLVGDVNSLIGKEMNRWTAEGSIEIAASAAEV
jgi:hypothetical protein